MLYVLWVFSIVHWMLIQLEQNTSSPYNKIFTLTYNNFNTWSKYGKGLISYVEVKLYLRHLFCLHWESLLPASTVAADFTIQEDRPVEGVKLASDGAVAAPGCSGIAGARRVTTLTTSWTIHVTVPVEEWVVRHDAAVHSWDSTDAVFCCCSSATSGFALFNTHYK